MAILQKFKTDFGTIHVTRAKRDGTMAYYQNGSFHSQSDKKGVSICAYIHVIHEIVRQVHARHILIIGCAGGTLATMLRRLNCRVTVVDINPMAFAIARRYFQLPLDVRCVRRDGIAYLRLTKKRYDAVIIDVFGSNNTVPAPFTSHSFFQKVSRILSPSGVMVMNVITAGDSDMRADTIARNAETSGMKTTLFDWPNEINRNTLIVSGPLQRTRIPSGFEPTWMTHALQGIVRRSFKKRAFV